MSTKIRWGIVPLILGLLMAISPAPASAHTQVSVRTASISAFPTICYGCYASKEYHPSQLVKAWQMYLMVEFNLSCSFVDGEFGPGTRDRTKQFQSKFGLSADGKVGPLTWGKAAQLSFEYKYNGTTRWLFENSDHTKWTILVSYAYPNVSAWGHEYSCGQTAFVTYLVD